MCAWNVIDSGVLDATVIMAKDAALLEQLEPGAKPTIHFYDWRSPSLTYGYFTDLAHHLHVNELEAAGLHCAKRPTGGGIIFHLTDMAFSILIPAGHSFFSSNTLENYAAINSWVARALERACSSHLVLPECCVKGGTPSFCMAQATPYDMVMEGKKVGGAAQRKTKKGLLHQATLALLPPPYDLLSQMIKEAEVIENMKRNSHYLFPQDACLVECRQSVKASLISNTTLQFELPEKLWK